MFTVLWFFFSAVITPCASGYVLLRAHWFYRITNHWEITRSLSTYFPLTQKYINTYNRVLQADFTIFVHEFSACTKYSQYFKITGSSHTQNRFWPLVENICTLLFKHKYNIIIPNHSQCTRYKNNIKITILKLRTCFAQLGAYYIFVHVCVKSIN